MQVFILGAKMDSVAKISDQAAPAAPSILVINAMAVTCGLVLVVLACVMTNGLDMSAGFF
jgi:hypothetical protein